MTNKEKLIETLQNAPIERTVCFIVKNAERPCRFCVWEKTTCEATSDFYPDCERGIKQWLESEVE